MKQRLLSHKLITSEKLDILLCKYETIENINNTTKGLKACMYIYFWLNVTTLESMLVIHKPNWIEIDYVYTLLTLQSMKVLKLNLKIAFENQLYAIEN